MFCIKLSREVQAGDRQIGVTSLMASEAVDSMAIQEKCMDLEEGQEQEGH